MLHRPGHSETDTLFVDDAGREAFVGDHLLVSPAYAEQGPSTTRPLARYLENLHLLAQEDPGTLHTGHGDDVVHVRSAVADRVAAAERRCGRIADLLRGSALTAFDVAGAVWPSGRVEWDPVLAVSEVVGHLELLVERGAVSEQLGSVRRFIRR